jgi:hypothetical protein
MTYEVAAAERQERVRERVQAAVKRPSRKKVWEPPSIEDFARRRTILAFDQSLTNTGWVRFYVHRSRLVVLDRGTLKIAVASKGHTSTMDKADILKRRLEASRGGWSYDLVVGEVTPVVGYRLESSLMAGYVLRQVFPDVHFVSRQAALALLLPPDKRFEKKHSNEVKERYVSYADNQAPGRWNEHERDALMLGLTWLYQIQRDLS